MLPLDLFPLNSVLFPDGVARLKVFEARYIDLVTRCLKHEQPFGFCLIRSGSEVGEIAEPFEVGTLAYITDWDMPQQGLFNIKVLGGQRFRIISHETGAGHILKAQVSLLAESPREKLDDRFVTPVNVLYKLMRKIGTEHFSTPQRTDDVDWVANRLAELLPIDNTDRQSLLEQDDALHRLQVIEDVLNMSDWKID